MSNQSTITAPKGNRRASSNVQSMLERLRPFEEWAAELAPDNAVRSQPGGAREFYDKFRAILQGMADGTIPSKSGWIIARPVRREGRPAQPRRACTDEAVIAHLKEGGGLRYQSATLALYFKVPTRQMTERLRRLVLEGWIRSMRAGSHTLFYLPTVDELAKESERYLRRFSDVLE